MAAERASTLIVGNPPWDKVLVEGSPLLVQSSDLGLMGMKDRARDKGDRTPQGRAPDRSIA